jgi:hypothetical protein
MKRFQSTPNGCALKGCVKFNLCIWIALTQSNPHNLSTILKLSKNEKVSIFPQWLGLEGLCGLWRRNPTHVTTQLS